MAQQDCCNTIDRLKMELKFALDIQIDRGFEGRTLLSTLKLGQLGYR